MHKPEYGRASAVIAAHRYVVIPSKTLSLSGRIISPRAANLSPSGVSQDQKRLRIGFQTP